MCTNPVRNERFLFFVFLLFVFASPNAVPSAMFCLLCLPVFFDYGALCRVTYALPVFLSAAFRLLDVICATAFLNGPSADRCAFCRAFPFFCLGVRASSLFRCGYPARLPSVMALAVAVIVYVFLYVGARSLAWLPGTRRGCLAKPNISPEEIVKIGVGGTPA